MPPIHPRLPLLLASLYNTKILVIQQSTNIGNTFNSACITIVTIHYYLQAPDRTKAGSDSFHLQTSNWTADMGVKQHVILDYVPKTFAILCSVETSRILTQIISNPLQPVSSNVCQLRRLFTIATDQNLPTSYQQDHVS